MPILDLLLELENTTLDEGLIVLRLFVLGILGEVSVGDRFLQSLSDFASLRCL